MAENTIDKAFIEEYESGVHVAYQRMGSKLRNTVRVKNNVKGKATTFQKVGKGSASQKGGPGADVPTMNVDHSSVKCTLADYYAADYHDDLDDIKINHDEKQVLMNAGAYALGRKTDEMIVGAMGETTDIIVHGSTGLTKPKILLAFEGMGNRDVPDDGQRFAIVGWKQWTELLQIEEFAKSDYIGDDQLPWKGLQAKRWLGTMWMPHSGLPLVGGVRKCFWYHKTAIGHAIGKDVTATMDWIGNKQAHFVNNKMSQGSVLIDGAGVTAIEAQE